MMKAAQEIALLLDKSSEMKKQKAWQNYASKLIENSAFFFVLNKSSEILKNYHKVRGPWKKMACVLNLSIKRCILDASKSKQDAHGSGNRNFIWQAIPAQKLLGKNMSLKSIKNCEILSGNKTFEMIKIFPKVTGPWKLWRGFSTFQSEAVL